MAQREAGPLARCAVASCRSASQSLKPVRAAPHMFLRYPPCSQSSGLPLPVNPMLAQATILDPATPPMRVPSSSKRYDGADCIDRTPNTRKGRSPERKINHPSASARSPMRHCKYKKTGEGNLSGIGSRPVSRVLYPYGRLSFIQAAGYPTAQATYPGALGRADPLPYLVLLQTGFAWLAVSPRRPVGSYSTLSPLPVRRTAVWRSAFCCAFQRSLSLGVTQRFALRSPDFPLRVWPYGLTRNDSPSDSRNVFQPLQDPFLGAGACWQKQYYSRHAARLDRRSLHAPQKAGSQRRQQTTTRRTPPTRRYCLRCRKNARSSKSDAGS